MKSLFAAAGLGEPAVSFTELRDVVSNLLARSYPNPGDDKKIVAMFRASAEDDSLGIPVRLDGDDDPLCLSGRDLRCPAPLIAPRAALS